MEGIIGIYSFLSKYFSFLFLYLAMCCFKPRFSGRRHILALTGAIILSGSLLQGMDAFLLHRYGYFWYVSATMLIGLPFVLWYYHSDVRPKLLLHLIYFIFMTGTRTFSTNFLRLCYGVLGRDFNQGVAFMLLADFSSFGVLALLCIFLRRSRFEASGLTSLEYVLLSLVNA